MISDLGDSEMTPSEWKSEWLHRCVSRPPIVQLRPITTLPLTSTKCRLVSSDPSPSRNERSTNSPQGGGPKTWLKLPMEARGARCRRRTDACVSRDFPAEHVAKEQPLERLGQRYNQGAQQLADGRGHDEHVRSSACRAGGLARAPLARTRRFERV